MALERFDLLLPAEIKQEIEERAVNKAVAPRVLGRMLLVEKVKELKQKVELKHRLFERLKVIFSMEGVVTSYLFEKVVLLLYALHSR